MSSWKFDQSVAEIFHNHALQHIPNYLSVIDKTVDVCQLYPTTAKIIDVGCAVGYTLTKLNQAGYKNLYGVDNSQDMLNKIDDKLATLIHSNKFPVDAGPFDVVIINWTLHFIEDKISYLNTVYNSLAPGGTLIVSDKTSTDPYAIDFYHKFKKRQGASDQEIANKAQQLVGVMFNHSVNWYLDTFNKLGFANAHIFDAHWCFTSFVCRKEI